ncbi:MAG: OmpA family protein [Deltaproteobacteria bacterium]|jgi:peptidoglycan-associated lipoprotein|nr:OmpA family protein [Deltaproteobacteria bacterium]
MKKLLMLIGVFALCLPLASCGTRTVQPTVVDDDNALRRGFLNDHVYFDFDRYNIRADQVSTLQAKAAYLNATGSASELQGYADERGTEAYNLALGDRRAKSARNYLIDLGISGSRLSTTSYGKSMPADPGHNEAAWARNRRVEFVLR